MSDQSGTALEQCNDETFEIPHRPERISHPPVEITNPETGEKEEVPGGSVREGYCRFDLTGDGYDPVEASRVVGSLIESGEYAGSWWEDQNAQMYDLVEHCALEVRMLPERLAIDAKSNTTKESVQRLVESITLELGGQWYIERDSRRLAA